MLPLVTVWDLRSLTETETVTEHVAIGNSMETFIILLGLRLSMLPLVTVWEPA